MSLVPSATSAASVSSGAHPTAMPEHVKQPASSVIGQVCRYFADPNNPLMMKIAMVVASALVALALGHLFGAALGHLLGAKILTLVVLSTVVVLGGASEMNRSRYEAAERQNSTDWLYMIASDTPPARYLPRICPEEIAVRTLDLGDRELSSIRPDEVPFTKYGQDQFGRRFLAMPVRGDVVVVHERYVDGSEWVLSGCPRRFSWIPFDPHDPARFFRVIQVQYQCDGNPLVFDIALQNYRRQQAGRAAPLEGTQPGAHGIYPGLTTHTGIDNNG